MSCGGPACGGVPGAAAPHVRDVVRERHDTVAHRHHIDIHKSHTDYSYVLKFIES